MSPFINRKTWRMCLGLAGAALFAAILVFIMFGKRNQSFQTLNDHLSTIWSVRFSPDGQCLATGSEDGTIALWVTESWHKKATLRSGDDAITSLIFTPGGDALISGGRSGEITIWHTRSWVKQAGEKYRTEPVSSLALSHDGKFLAIQYETSCAIVVDRQTDRVVSTFDLTGANTPTGSLAFDPTDQWLFTGGPRLEKWEIRSGKRIEQEEDSSMILSLALSVDGRWLLTGDTSWRVCLWDVEKKERNVLGCHNSPVSCVAFSPSGLYAASGGWYGSFLSPSTISIWDLHTRRMVREMRGHSGGVTSLAFSPDGRILASGGYDHEVKLWHMP